MALLILFWILSTPKINRLAINLLLIFLLTQLLSLFFSINIAVGITKIEQFLIAGLFGLYLSSKKINSKYLLAAIVLFCYVIINSVMTNKLSITSGPNAKSIWDIFSFSPLFGIGLNNYAAVSNAHFMSSSESVPNIYVLALVESGLVGFFGLLILIMTPLVKLYKLTSPHLTVLLPLLCWVIIIFLGMIDNFLLAMPEGYRLFFLIWGLSLSIAAI